MWVARRLPQRKPTSAGGTEPAKGWFRTIGDVRNSLLVAASGVYLLGYAVWSMHAWQKNLGLLPLLDSQYFIAGAVPAATLWVAAYAFKGGRRLIKILERELGLNRSGWRLYVSRALLGVSLVAVVVFLASSSDWFERLYPLVAERIAIWSALVWVVTAFFAPWAGGKFQNWFRIVMVGYLVVALCAVGAITSFWVLGWLPQELGGIRPRCAAIAAPRSSLSQEMLEQVFANDAGPDGVIQSKTVSILYSGRYLLFTLQGFALTNSAGPVVYELPRDIVKAISWYPSCPTVTQVIVTPQ